MRSEDEIRERLQSAKEFNSTHRYGYWQEIPDAFAKQTAYNTFVRVRHEEFLLKWVLQEDNQ